MRTYFDTSILLKIYVREENSPLALALITAEENPIPFSHLLELELKTAIRIKHGRGEISLVEQRGALKAIEEDFSNGVLVRPKYDLEAVFRRAEILSAKHASITLGRSADIWHIAAAVECGFASFASLDARQRKVAELAGLVALPKTTIEIRQHESLAGSLICGRQMVGKRHPSEGVE